MKAITARHRRRRQFRAVTAAAALSAAVTALAGCSGSTGDPAAPGGTGAQSPASGLMNVTIAQNPTAAALFIAVAQQEGFFKKNGLDATIVKVTNMALMPAALASNQYNFANIVPPLFLNARLQRLPVVATAGGNMESAADPQFGVVVRAGSPVKSLAGLKGKRVATPTLLGNLSECLNWDLHQHSIQPSAVSLTVVPFNDMKAQLDAGEVDAALMQTPQTSALAKQGYRVVTDPCPAIGLPQQTSFQMSNATWAKEHPAAVKAVQESITEAGAWAQAHPAQARDVLTTWSGQPVSQTAAFDPPRVVGTPPTAADLGHWASALTAMGAMKSEPDLSQAIFPG